MLHHPLNKNRINGILSSAKTIAELKAELARANTALQAAKPAPAPPQVAKAAPAVSRAVATQILPAPPPPPKPAAANELVDQYIAFSSQEARNGFWPKNKGTLIDSGINEVVLCRIAGGRKIEGFARAVLYLDRQRSKKRK